MNDRSSRSHTVVSIFVHAREMLAGTTCRGCLQLVDLAGERFGQRRPLRCTTPKSFTLKSFKLEST
eukprot:3822953-Pyramimonas_sp.AAC.1